MSSQSQCVPVDGVLTSVVQYTFIKNAYFVISSSASHDDWLNFHDQDVDSIWVYALKSADIEKSQPNGWKISLELNKSTKMVTLELYETRQARGTVFLVRAFSDNQNAAPLSDWKSLIQIGICHAGRRMNPGFKFRDILQKIQAKGLLTYQLDEGRGHRFWIKAILSTIDDAVHEVPRTRTLPEEMDELMRRCWIKTHQYAQGYGFKDEPENRLNIMEGKWRRN